MSMDSLDDSAPNRGLPPRAILYAKMQKLFEAQSTTCTRQLIEEHNRLHPDHQISSLEELVVPHYDPAKRLPIRVGGAEQASFISLYGSQDDGFCTLDFKLYADGSPYVFDEDVANNPDPELSSDYELCASPEMPPFIVHHAELEKSKNKDTFGRMESEISYLDRIRQEGRQPLYLTDEEAQSFLDILPLLEIDQYETKEENRNIGMRFVES